MSASCDAAYCSHVFEHLSLTDFRKALRETHRILKPGGRSRGVLADLEIIIGHYFSDPSSQASIRFMKSTLLGLEERVRGPKSLVQETFGNSCHLWMWDYEGLKHELSVAGFRCIRRASFGDSETPFFADVEVENRWQGCLGFECLR